MKKWRNWPKIAHVINLGEINLEGAKHVMGKCNIDLWVRKIKKTTRIWEVTQEKKNWYIPCLSNIFPRLVRSPGGLPDKKEGVLVGHFWKEPLRGTKILFCGRGFKFWFTLRGRYQFWNNTFYHLSYFFRLNTLKGTAKAPAVDLSRLNTLRVMIQMRVSRLKKINVCKKNRNKCLYFLDLYELLISSSGCHWRICKLCGVLVGGKTHLQIYTVCSLSI